MPPRHPRHIFKLSDLKFDEIDSILKCALDLKKNPDLHADALSRRTAVIVLDRPSIRTRLSFEVALGQLGGMATTYRTWDLASDKHARTLAEASIVFGSYADLIVSGMESQASLEALSKHSRVPIINAEDTVGNPCQVLTDLMTMFERKGDLSALKIAYLGDLRRKLALDLMRAASLMGMKLVAANLQGVSLPQAVLDAVEMEMPRLAAGGPGEATIVDDALKAVVDADIIYTDAWMTFDSSESTDGHFAEPVMNLQTTEAMLSRAGSDAIFFHCLPCSGQTCEVAAAHIEGNESIVFDQTHNRLHVQKALLLHLSKFGAFPPHDPRRQKPVTTLAG